MPSKKNLLEVEGWKRFKWISKRQKNYCRWLIKLNYFLSCAKIQYGFEVPCHYYHVIHIDEQAGNTKWQNSTRLEMSQLDKYTVFIDLVKGGKPPRDYRSSKYTLSLMLSMTVDIKNNA